MADRQIDELSFASDISDATTFAANNNASTYEAQQVSVGQIATFVGARAEAVHNLGDLHYNKSNLAIDNPGAVPGWTGEYVTNANNVYPDLYTWLKTSHPELCVTRAQYDTDIIETDECKYFVIDEESGSIRFPKYKYVAPDYPWIYVFNAAVPQSTTQGAAYTEALVSKASVDLSNLSEAGEIKIGQNARNIGEVVHSILPLTSAGLHLLDGSLLSGSGSYANFVTYMKRLYNENPNAPYFAQTTTVNKFNVNLVGSTQLWADGGVSAFGTNQYMEAKGIPNTETATTWEMVTQVRIDSTPTANWSLIGNSSDAPDGGGLILRPNGSYLHLCCWISNGSWFISGADTGIDCKVGMNYIKVAFTGSAYVFSYSDDGETWVQKNSIASTTKMKNWTTNPRYGISAVNNYPFSFGSIFCQGTYIKVDGDYFWRAQTSTTYTPAAYYNYCVETYGSCGKFLVDTANNTVRLPKISNILEGTSSLSAIGDLVEAGLPNITGRFGAAFDGASTTNHGMWAEGAFVGDHRLMAALWWANNKGYGIDSTTFDASRCSDIYGNSTTVQPQTIKVLLYIVVANAAKTELQVDIDNIMTDVNGKVDKSSLVEAQVVVRSYRSTTGWYRVWSDGWCEQGGHIEESGTNVVQVTFPIQFVSLPTLMTSVNSTARTTFLDNNIDVYSLTTSGFIKQYIANVGTGWSWYACGYIE